MTAAIDLNCDMGEGMGDDAALMPLVTSANVACGFHAGGPEAMRRTVRLAREHGVAVGAHPGFPDRAGFGRRLLAASPDEVRDDVTYQIGALWAFCRAEGVPLAHVKAHGALYNASADDPELARAICEAARAVDPALTVVCLARTPMVEVARALGVPVAEEAFADRAYTPAGRLVSRRSPGAVLRDPAEVAARVSLLARERRVVAVDGTAVSIDARTVCVHGDTPGAARLAAVIRERLRADGVRVEPLARPG
ncbi:MAG TPA: 5-oxoprolinase subunit PxpA [Anaeromyxobacteraceae bacterium]|nr:5-oxoprolinase subunit PxpA [Anaeromyxobacteraceae bacterium]